MGRNGQGTGPQAPQVLLRRRATHTIDLHRGRVFNSRTMVLGGDGLVQCFWVSVRTLMQILGIHRKAKHSGVSPLFLHWGGGERKTLRACLPTSLANK